MRSTSIAVKKPPGPEAVAEFSKFHGLPEGILSGRFRLIDQIGEGALSKVFSAVDLESGETVAIKALRERFFPSHKLRRLLETEAMALARSLHPGVVRLISRSEDPPYISLELLHGASPARMGLDTRGVVAFAAEVCDILSAVHSAGVVHRDIKPENIIIMHASVRLFDFDYAKVAGEWDYALAAGHPIGTPHYMAPEQAVRPADAVPASDLYSLGAMIYELLSGSPPFEDDEPEHVLKMHRFDAPPPLLSSKPIPDGLRQVVSRCLAKKPEERFRDASQMGEELGRILRSLRRCSEPLTG